MELAKKLILLRQRERLSQQELADKIAMSRSAVGMYEAGQRMPSTEVLQAYADFFHVSTDYLLGRSDDASWSDTFRKNLAIVLQSYDAADIKDAGIDMSLMNAVLSGTTVLTLDIACSIADEIGEDLDYLLGHDETPAPESESGLNAEIIRLLGLLSEDKKTEALHYLRFLAERADKQ